MSQKDNEITRKIQSGIDPEDIDAELDNELYEERREAKRLKEREKDEQRTNS